MDVDKEGLKCQYCETSFPTRQDLAIHIDSAHLGNNKKCFICEREFPSRSNLSRHLREVHFGLAPPKNISCPKCPRLFNEKRFLYYHFNKFHLTTDDSRNMDNCKKCVLCDADFGEFRDHFYNNHCGEVLKTTLDPGGYTCDTIMCNYWTKAHSQMQSHCQQMFHCSSDLKQLSLAKNSPELATQEKVDSGERIYGKVMRSIAGGKKDVVTPTPGPENKSPCPHCVIKFPTKADVEIHVKSMHPLEKKGTWTVFVGNTGIDWEKYVEEHKWKPIDDETANSKSICRFCDFQGIGKMAKTARYMERHMKKYHPGVCSLCNFVGNGKYAERALYLHVKTHHRDYLAKVAAVNEQ